MTEVELPEHFLFDFNLFLEYLNRETEANYVVRKPVLVEKVERRNNSSKRENDKT